VLPHVNETRLVLRAALARWPITPEMREKAVRCAEAVLDDPGATRYHKLTAVRALAALDSLNAQRERTASLERVGATRVGLEALHRAMADPSTRALLLEASNRLTVAPEAPPAADPPPA
jgi:hypothetical protein